jgi:tetratricopeptide (TPR) repeat protein
VLSALAAPAALQTVPLALLVLGASLSPGAAPAGARSDQKTAAGSWALRIAAVVLAALVGAYGATLLSVSRTIGQPPPKTVEAAADTWRFDPLLNYWASLTWGYAGQQDPSLLNSKPDLVAIQRAVALEPTNPIYQTELARTLGFYGMPSDQVLAAFAKAVQLAPNDPEARAAYAEYLIFLKDLPAARKQLDAGETLARSSEVYRVEGLYYRALGDPGKAAQFENMAGEIRASLGFTDLPLMGGQ